MDENLCLKSVSFAYKNQKNLLNNINLKINRGEIVAIVGSNGCGKSTLIKLFNGIFLPDSGDVIFCGMNTKNKDEIYNIRQKIGMVFQNPENQIFELTVEDDIAFNLINFGLKFEDAQKKTDEILKNLNIFDLKKRSIQTLSGGQKQLVAICGVLATNSEYLVFDEPTTFLDGVNRKKLLRIIFNLNKKFGKTIIFITHFSDEALHANRVLVMEEGKIVADDSPKKIFSDVEFAETKKLEILQSTELLYKLRNYGLNVNLAAFSKKDCALEINKLCNFF